MDLYSGLPFSIAKNPLFDHYHPLEEDYTTDVAIIGSGITGALVAHELCSAGIRCAVFDKRTIATGSTVASTSQLQYDVDVPLCKMLEMLPENCAVGAWHASLRAVNDLGKVFRDIGFDPAFEKVPTLYLASNTKGLELVRREYGVRKKYHLPVELADASVLLDEYGIKAPGALRNYTSAQMDSYAGTVALLKYHMKNSGLEIFSHTEITAWKENPRSYELTTDRKYKVHCKYVVVAAGYEAGPFVPGKLVNLDSTYAIISDPVAPEELWHERCLIWETKTPYMYMRTTAENRIIVGGGDVGFKDPVQRDALLRRKVVVLEKQFRKIFPRIPFHTDMAWCGTFSSTRDGLPYIGAWPGKPRMLFALGYGGNGTTFSMIAAQVIRNILQDIPDERKEIFGFERTL